MSTQLDIAGTEPPEKNADVELAIDGWLAAKDEQRHAADTTKVKHATLLAHLDAAGLASYPFIDPATGKKKRVVVKRDPKAAITRMPKQPLRDDDRDRKPESEPKEETVEHRTVRRVDVEDEIDPFGALRTRMDVEG